MNDFPRDLLYTKTHEWVREEDDLIYTIGITDYAQQQLGELVFVDLPRVGTEVHSGDEIAVLESIKTAADVYCPLVGEIVEINETLQQEPNLVNKDPYNNGWLFKIKIEDTYQLDSLINSTAYQELIAEEE